MRRLLLTVLLILVAARVSAQDSQAFDKIYLGSAGCVLQSGAGSPEGAVNGNVCDRWVNTTTGETYRKLTGTGNTGWIGPSALTKTDDTNVTLTLGGSASTSLMNPASLTLGWTGQLAAGRGGTGIASYAVGDLLYASASTTLSKLADVAVGSYLRSGGVTTAPVWSTLTLPNAASTGQLLVASGSNVIGAQSPAALTKADDTNVTLTLSGSATTALVNAASVTAGWTGQLAVSRGGTGLGTLTNNGVVYGNGTGNVGITAQGGSNTVLTANGAAPSFSATPTVTSLTTTGLVSVGSTLGVTGVSTFTGDGNFVANAGTSTFVSQTTGWRVTAAGAADFRYLTVDEMRAKVFTADREAVLAGSQRITKSFSTVSQAFTCPAAAGTSTLWVNDALTFGDAAIFVSGDSVVLHSMTRAAFGPFTIADCVGVVTSYSDGTGGNAGQQSWTFTRGSGGSAGTMTASTVVPVNELVQDLGTTGNGYVESSAVDGAAGVNAPYTQVVTWATAPVTANLTTRCRLGNLKGITSATEYGLLCGNYSGNAYIRLSDANAEIKGIPLTVGNITLNSTGIHVTPGTSGAYDTTTSYDFTVPAGDTLGVTGSRVVGSGNPIQFLIHQSNTGTSQDGAFIGSSATSYDGSNAVSSLINLAAGNDALHTKSATILLDAEGASNPALVSLIAHSTATGSATKQQIDLQALSSSAGSGTASVTISGLDGTTATNASFNYASGIARFDMTGLATITATGIVNTLKAKGDAGASGAVGVMWNAATSGDNVFMTFQTEAGGTTRGNIDYNRAGTAVRYNTTSDQRLKIDRGLSVDTSVLVRTRVHEFDWKETGARARGVFAQEALDVLPVAVSVGSDERDATGHLVRPWGVDYSKYVPDLIVGWQAHDRQIAALEAEIAALKKEKR